MRAFLLLLSAATVFADGVDQRVVGGSNTNIAEWPYQASLRVSGSHSCGATLIGTTKGVTAAHCGGGAIATYSILSGSTDRTVENCGTCAVRSLTSFPRHGSFVNNANQGYPNDIGVIRFSNIPSNGNTGYATMAPSNAGNYADQSCIITGWGRTCATCGLPASLQQGTMTVLTNAACANAWSTAQINNGHVCALAESVSACSGDSGGPLICSGILVGTNSWGQSQCSPSFPSVFSRISYFRGWIDVN